MGSKTAHGHLLLLDDDPLFCRISVQKLPQKIKLLFPSVLPLRNLVSFQVIANSTLQSSNYFLGDITGLEIASLFDDRTGGRDQQERQRVGY